MVDRVNILHITTIPMTLMFLRGQAGYMRTRGVKLAALSSPGDELASFSEQEGVPVHATLMLRRISPFRDAVALGRMSKVLRTLAPQVVHAHTPKGGLLGTLAAWLTGVPVRIYHIRGLPFMTARGFRRQLLRRTEQVACGLAHQVLCVSHSIRNVAVAENLCAPDKIKVLAGGSGNGVDALGRFNPDSLDPNTRKTVRAAHRIPPDALVVGFVGRIVRDKGVVELEDAWRRLREEFSTAHLLMVGPCEPQDPVPKDVERRLQEDSTVHFNGAGREMPPLYAGMDLVVLPTYREGFPNVPLEAAAMGLPVVATRIPGCVDAVADGVTGTLVSPGDAGALAEAIRAYLRDPDLRRRHGTAGRERVLREFRQEVIWEALYQEYVRLLRERGLPVPAGAGADGGAEQGCGAPSKGTSALKRRLDVTAAGLGLLVLSPVLLATALLVRLCMGSPVLFRHVRPGYKGRPFELLKFRTMHEADGSDGAPLPDAARVSPVGEFLRRTSLDELPQLWNVLRGDMSLVGPRPLLAQYLPLYTPEQSRRHDVKPGMTGWAQVNGRNTISWEEKFRLDVWYVDHQSLSLDMRILLMTVKKVFRREGINQGAGVTMPPFEGARNGSKENGAGVVAPGGAN